MARPGAVCRRKCKKWPHNYLHSAETHLHPNVDPRQWHKEFPYFTFTLVPASLGCWQCEYNTVYPSLLLSSWCGECEHFDNPAPIQVSGLLPSYLFIHILHKNVGEVTLVNGTIGDMVVPASCFTRGYHIMLETILPLLTQLSLDPVPRPMLEPSVLECWIIIWDKNLKNNQTMH